MKIPQPFNVSVRDLVAFSFMPDSLFADFTGTDKALSGIKGHKSIREQRPPAKNSTPWPPAKNSTPRPPANNSTPRPPDYKAEVPVSHTVQHKGITLHISGRIDGIFTTYSPVIIEEIKTCSSLPDTDKTNETQSGNPIHWAQAQCYGYMYAVEHVLTEVIIRLTYFNTENKKSIEFEKPYTTTQLEEIFLGLVRPYADRLELRTNWQHVRDQSIAGLEFPYSSYRGGQRKLAVQVYRSVKAKTILFARAPTGIGKTAAVLFPALKALEQGLINKIFYLTARTTGRAAAVKTLDHMRQKGLRIKHVVLTAKEKICFCPEIFCDTENCIYAKDYYNKVKNALTEIYQHERYNREQVEQLAGEFRVCPFELSLDISLATDCITCDYNYVFDPRVKLQRYFNRVTEPYLFLIDEAHNLPDRARRMFSARLLKKTILQLKRTLKTSLPTLAGILNSINKILIEQRKTAEAENRGYTLSYSLPEKLLEKVSSFAREAGNWLDKNIHTPFRPPLLDFYFDCRNFIRVAGDFDTNYIFYFEKRGKGGQMAKLFCIDPAPLITRVMKNCVAAVFFSATLLPMNYFKSVLLIDHEVDELMLPSPFPRKNLQLLVYKSISTRYIHRAESYSLLAGIVADVYHCCPGNYLVYFPSYAYMQEVASIFLHQYNDIYTLVQSRNMTEDERDNFLSHFSANSKNFNTPATGGNFDTASAGNNFNTPATHTVSNIPVPGTRGTQCNTPAANKHGTQPVVGFVIMGGIFGEGIDLVGEKLIGVIVVGVGLPQLCLERDLIRQYYTDMGKNGFRYSYQAPGFNKVMQAAGRVIRTEQDKGVVVLVDSRFINSSYRNFFPSEWNGFTGVNNTGELRACLDNFWNLL